jgi:hypothetical protein
MSTFLVYYKEPMVVSITADTQEEANELFLNGDFTGEFSDPDGCIEEADLILTLD